MEIAFRQTIFLLLFFFPRPFLLEEICHLQQWACRGPARRLCKLDFFTLFWPTDLLGNSIQKQHWEAAWEEGGRPVGHDLMFSRQCLCLAANCTLLQFFNIFKRQMISLDPVVQEQICQFFPVSIYFFTDLTKNHINPFGYSLKLGAQIKSPAQIHKLYFRSPAFHLLALWACPAFSVQPLSLGEPCDGAGCRQLLIEPVLTSTCRVPRNTLGKGMTGARSTKVWFSCETLERSRRVGKMAKRRRHGLTHSKLN